MKTKHFLSVAVGLFITCQLFAAYPSMQERTEARLQTVVSEDSGQGGGQRAKQGGGRTGDKNPTGDPDVGNPIGDGLIFVAVLAGIYGFAVVNAKRKRTVKTV
jgi:hypothetical protein